jgi:hypothetical protein
MEFGIAGDHAPTDQGIRVDGSHTHGFTLR